MDCNCSKKDFSDFIQKTLENKKNVNNKIPTLLSSSSLNYPSNTIKNYSYSNNYIFIVIIVIIVIILFFILRNNKK